MALLPAGFVLPPPAYLAGLVAGAGVVAAALWRLAPAVTAETVLALAPWMGVGAALHALYVVGAAPDPAAPLLGAPAVYGTVFVVAGTVWAGLATATRVDPRRVAGWLGAVGTVAFLAAAAAVLTSGSAFAPIWPAVGLLLAFVVAAAAWRVIVRLAPEAAATGWPGRLVVFAHALDGLSTAIGVDVIGFGERTPLSRLVMDIAGALPTAETVGVGWLFVLVKLAVAGAVVALFAGLVDEDPRQGYLLLAVIAAVGLGPGIHNLLLYAVAS
ncbi:MAG: DUF63 family protein [Halobacteriales archaeon]